MEAGTITDRYNYGAYGEIVQRSGTTANAFLYIGQYGIATDANGLYHMRARHYNPEIKAFINEDDIVGNIEDTQSLNRYAYAEGNPIIYIDPEGHFITIAAGAGIGAIIGAGGSIISQGLTKGWSNINAKEVLVSAGVGLVSGAVAGSGVGLLVAVGVNAGLGSLNYAGTQLVNDQQITGAGLAINAGIGAIAGAIGGSGMLSGKVGQEVANIKSAKILAKSLGLKSGQEIAKMEMNQVIKSAVKTNTIRTAGDAGWSAISGNILSGNNYVYAQNYK